MNIENCKKMYQELSDKHNCNYKLSFTKKVERFRSAGSCHYKIKIIKLQPIFVEKNCEDIVRNVILHEIAHALMPKHHHNKFWKRKLIEIGGDGKRCYGKEVIR